jgi:hypothetical protein
MGGLVEGLQVLSLVHLCKTSYIDISNHDLIFLIIN